VFDLDGTLGRYRARPDRRAQLRARPRGLAAGAAPRGAQHDRRPARAKLIEARARSRGPRPPACGTSPALRRISSITTRPISPTPRVPFEGVEAALDDLSARGYRFAVCTNKLEWLSKLLLDRPGIERGDFSAICGADTFGVSKTRPGDPATDHRARAGGAGVRRHHGGRRRARCRRRAGAPASPVIGVEFGYTDVPIADLKPDRLIGHMKDLPAAVESLMKTP